MGTEKIKCGSCGKNLTDKMEVEYSQHVNEFFCGPDCATDFYFNYMMSSPVDFTDSLPEDAKIKNGYLVKEW